MQSPRIPPRQLQAVFQERFQPPAFVQAAANPAVVSVTAERSASPGRPRMRRHLPIADLQCIREIVPVSAPHRQAVAPRALVTTELRNASVSSGCVSKAWLRSSGAVPMAVCSESKNAWLDVAKRCRPRFRHAPCEMRWGSAIQVLRRCISMSRILDTPTASRRVRCRRCGALPVAQHPSDGRLARLPASQWRRRCW